jgi:hypothetical protein
VGKVKQIAQRVGCQGNLHSIGVAMRVYLNENRDVMPYAAAMPSLELNEEPRICDVLADYMGGRRELRCPADTAKNFYQSEGSSYEYNTLLGGEKVSEAFLTEHMGEDRTPVMHDYEPFHGLAGEPGAMNYLFADMHVGDLE